MQRQVNRDSSTPQGVYQVWHREGDAFHQVGGVKVANLLVAAELTMKGNPADWMERDEGGKAPANLRQSQSGDVLVSPGGEALQLVGTTYGFTFEAIDFAQVKAIALLAAEHRVDFRMGQEEAARGEFLSDVGKLRQILAGQEIEAQPPREQERDTGREM